MKRKRESFCHRFTILWIRDWMMIWVRVKHRERWKKKKDPTISFTGEDNVYIHACVCMISFKMNFNHIILCGIYLLIYCCNTHSKYCIRKDKLHSDEKFLSLIRHRLYAMVCCPIITPQCLNYVVNEILLSTGR